jgi:hypothetical protein
MSTCTDVRSLLPLVVGGDLEEDQALAVVEHLETGCEPCAGVLRELQRVRGRLLELPERSPAPAVDLWPGVRATLAAEGRLGGAPIVLRRARVGWGGMSLSAAAAALLVAGALWLAQRDPGVPAGASDEPTVAEGGVTPDLPPTLVGGPQASGLRPLAPDEEPFALEAELFGAGRAGAARPLRVLPADPARPTLAGDRGGP